MNLETPMRAGRWRRVAACGCIILMTGLAACKSSSDTTGTANGSGNTPLAAGEPSRTPPFQTKEPERYQATMLITTTLGGNSPVSNVPNLLSREMLIARDGTRRRSDFELIPGQKLTFLQTPEGRFLLHPAKKIYADLNATEKDATNSNSGSRTSGGAAPPPDFAPERLLNEQLPGARYEKLGTEVVNGRTATKYRVTITGETGAAQGRTTESLIWVDESLGMPVKSESTSEDGSKYSMELRNLKEQPDAGLFEVPGGYRKVSLQEIYAPAP